MKRNNLIEAYEFYELLYDKYAAKAYGFLLQNTNSKQDAEKLMIDIFYKIWQNLETYKTDTEKQIKKIVVSSYYQSQSQHQVVYDN